MKKCSYTCARMLGFKNEGQKREPRKYQLNTVFQGIKLQESVTFDGIFFKFLRAEVVGNSFLCSLEFHSHVLIWHQSGRNFLETIQGFIFLRF